MYAFKIVIRSRRRRETVYEESPNFLETGCRRNPGERELKESATENNHQIRLVRMKRRGKSAPSLR